jgi:ElaB/YqjD/DUF883 family membrane-anchored ribosome-binding protein
VEHAGDLAEQAVQSAEHAIKSTRRLANEALDNVRDGSRQLLHKAQHASDHTADAIRDDPLKAILIAAATGAALMALVSLVNHSRARH